MINIIRRTGVGKIVTGGIFGVSCAVAAYSSQTYFFKRNHKLITNFGLNISHSEGSATTSETEIDDVETTDSNKEMIDEEKWKMKAEQCPLCKMALSSPCIKEFKEFDICLDKLKEKYGDKKAPDEEGMKCFSRFHDCMFANMEFFQQYVEERKVEEQKNIIEADSK